MADKVSFSIDLSGLSDFTPVESMGSSSLLKQDGYYGCIVNTVKLGKSGSGNNKFVIGLTVQDADEKGAQLIADVLVSGVDKNGGLNVRKLGEFMTSMGMTQEQIRAFAGNGTQPGEAVAQQLAGKACYVSVEAETYNGNTRSKVNNFVTKQRYDDSVAANAHRKPHRAQMAFAGAPVGGAQMGAPMGAQMPSLMAPMQPAPLQYAQQVAQQMPQQPQAQQVAQQPMQMAPQMAALMQPLMQPLAQTQPQLQMSAQPTAAQNNGADPLLRLKSLNLPL
jgi:hypothetical protein